MSEAHRKKHQYRQSAEWMVDSDGTPLGLLGPDGKVYRVVYEDGESRALSSDPAAAPASMVGFWPGLGVEAAGAIQDLSGAVNHLLYTSAATDLGALANVGFFSSETAAQGSPKGFEVPYAAFAPQPSLGHGFFVSFVMRFAAFPAGLSAVAGNAGDLNHNGFAVYCNNTGNLRLYIKGATLGQQQVASETLVLNTSHRVTLHLDPSTQVFNAWLDGKRITTNYSLAAAGALHLADAPWWFGGGGHPTRNRATIAVRWADACVLWLKPGQVVASPIYCDWLLRTRPAYQLTARDVAR